MTTSQPAEGAPRLRADAQRNVAGIRQAALGVFRERGLGTALDEVARAAGVSKGTIYHRFGGRQGLIEAVVEELVGERIAGIVAEAREIPEPVAALETFLRRVWMLQFDEPAANDVLLRAHPDSPALASLCERASGFGGELLAAAQATGEIREDLASDDLYLLIWERGIIARACDRQSRADYERRSGFVLAGLRSVRAPAAPGPSAPGPSAESGPLSAPRTSRAAPEGGGRGRDPRGDGPADPDAPRRS